MSGTDPTTLPPAGPIGSSPTRREDARFTTGRGRYLADLAAGAAHVVFVRSSHPHARVTGVDTTAAAVLPGVLAVFGAAELPVLGRAIPPLHRPDPAFTAATSFTMAEQRLPVLATDRVHYVGHPVVAVVATDRYLAEDAAEAVRVDYEPLPAVVDAVAALAPGAPPLFSHLPDNRAAGIEVAFGPGPVGDGLTTVTGTYRMGRHGAVPLECRGVRTSWDALRGRVEMWTSTQIPHQVRGAVCAVAGWSTDELRVAVPDVGGGFGTKANVYAEEVVLAVLARETGLALIWVEDRSEHLTSSAQGRDQIHDTRLTVDTDGRIVHWADDFVVDIGAGSLWVAGIVANTAVHLLGPYRVPSVAISGRAAFTTKTVVAQYRGAGRPEMAAARRLGLSGPEIRRRNLLTAADLPYPRPLPYRDGVPIRFDGGDYRACLDAALELLPGVEVLGPAELGPDEVAGHGVGAYLEATGRGPWETGRVVLLSDGRFQVTSGAASAGQSHQTVWPQIAAEALGVSLDAVHCLTADTDTVPHGLGSYASRSAVVAGSAVFRAGRSLRRQARQRAARLLAVAIDEIADTVSGFGCGDGRTVAWTDLAAAAGPGGSQEADGPLDVLETFSPTTVTWTMGVHAALVAVHRRTGLTRVLHYAVAHEGGVELNPQVVHGQIVGGVAQGLGGTLLEEFRYDHAGQPQSTTLAGYLLPGTTEMPPVRVAHLAVDTPDNPLGARGAGESGTIAAYPTVAAAIDDALRRAGLPAADPFQVSATPVDPAAVLAALRGVRATADPVTRTFGRTPAPVGVAR
jgi:carbon-monoxide dehydrogenase large subunit